MEQIVYVYILHLWWNVFSAANAVCVSPVFGGNDAGAAFGSQHSAEDRSPSERSQSGWDQGQGGVEDEAQSSSGSVSGAHPAPPPTPPPPAAPGDAQRGTAAASSSPPPRFLTPKQLIKQVLSPSLNCPGPPDINYDL